MSTTVHQQSADNEGLACDNCDAENALELPETHKYADRFTALCPECAGMYVCTDDDCDEPFWTWSDRAEHIQSEHTDDGVEGAAKCSKCDGEASPERRAVPDPRTSGNRVQLVCPACGDYLGGGRFH